MKATPVIKIGLAVWVLIAGFLVFFTLKAEKLSLFDRIGIIASVFGIPAAFIGVAKLTDRLSPEESGVRRAEPHSSNDVVSGSAEMIFALDIEHGLLFGFAAEKDALADFTKEEIAAEMVVFWDERGNPLRAPPPEPSGSGGRALEPDLSPDRLPLAMQLEDVEHIDPKCPLRTTDEVRKFISAGKRERS